MASSTSNDSLSLLSEVGSDQAGSSNSFCCGDSSEDTVNWLLTYEVPSFPITVTEAISKCSSGISDLPSSIRRKICQLLVDSISTYTLYPDHTQYHGIVLLLLKKYPGLADKNARNPTGIYMGGKHSAKV